NRRKLKGLSDRSWHVSFRSCASPANPFSPSVNRDWNSLVFSCMVNRLLQHKLALPLTRGLSNLLHISIVVVSVVFVVSVWVGENGAAINNFKKQKPSAFIILIMVASCILISMLGSIVVFMWAITLPLILIFAHASCRKRNMQNKLENKMDGSGLKKTFMGILLDSLGQQEETIQKIHNFLN
uniref:PRA1 family protein n=1 Tax=Neolamprologus brichardi TaxID=32507 RepID=A0A3Q4I7T2_NEOBR